MTPTPELHAQLRFLLDESIPLGGTDQDTLFLNSEIDMMLTVSTTMAEAAAMGWTVKAQRVMSPGAVVEAQFGSERYKFTSPKDLADFALKMAESFRPGGDNAAAAGGGGAYVVSICKPRLPGIMSAIRAGCDDDCLWPATAFDLSRGG